MFTMFLCSFVPVIKYSVQVICPVFFEGLNRIFTWKTLPQLPTCGWQDGCRAICAAQQCEMPHVQDLANNNLFLKSYNSLWKTNTVLWDTMNCHNAVHGNQNSLPNTHKSLTSVSCLINNNDAVINCNANANHNAFTSKNDKYTNLPIRISQSHVLAVTCKVRDGEPSRVSLRRVMNSLKHGKLRKKYKCFIKKSISVSSGFYSSATNCKTWHIKYARRQDSFYCNYFEKA